MSCSVMWFRRDLRLADHPALRAALDSAEEVLPVFVLDPALLGSAGVRKDRLLASVAALSQATDGRLVVREGDPTELIPALAKAVQATQVHVSRESTPFGHRRDQAVEQALGEVELVRTGSPYAIGPGSIFNGSGQPYKVFTPFSKAWRAQGWRDPAPKPSRPRWATLNHRPPGRQVELPDADADDVGEGAAGRRWRAFLADDLAGYAHDRDRPDHDSTSRMSAHLKFGEIHPRTLLADLAQRDSDDDAHTYATELCWREFYADVLWHNPSSSWQDLNDQLKPMGYDSGPETERLIEAWKQGRTGFPIVDAGMRQLLAQGWMHNRLRMITASFLIKDLHVWWPIGARHFLDHLLDGDIASNNHGWQWVAGTGTDAAPYFRIFNPITQGLKFDPQGEYVRRWVPELAHLSGKAAHEPWKADNGYVEGYPEPIVDHQEERAEALSRYQHARSGTQES